MLFPVYNKNFLYGILLRNWVLVVINLNQTEENKTRKMNKVFPQISWHCWFKKDFLLIGDVLLLESFSISVSILRVKHFSISIRCSWVDQGDLRLWKEKNDVNLTQSSTDTMPVWTYRIVGWRNIKIQAKTVKWGGQKCCHNHKMWPVGKRNHCWARFTKHFQNLLDVSESP